MDAKFFVPFDTAQQLKKKGYPNNTEMLYDNETGELISSAAYANPKYWIGDKYMYLIAAPTYHEVVDWLEEKGIGIEVILRHRYKTKQREWNAGVFYSDEDCLFEWGLTRETALNAAILKALEML